MPSRRSIGLRGRLTNHLTLRVAARISHRQNRINFKRSKKEMAREYLGRKQPSPTRMQGIRLSIKPHCSLLNRTIVFAIQQVDHYIARRLSIGSSPRDSRCQFTSFSIFYVLAILVLRESN